jgi:hypothetical protein
MPSLFHLELDRHDGITRLDRAMTILVGIDQYPKHLETVVLDRARRGAPQALDLGERSRVVLVIAKGAKLHLRSSNIAQPSVH